MMMIQIIELK